MEKILQRCMYDCLVSRHSLCFKAVVVCVYGSLLAAITWWATSLADSGHCGAPDPCSDNLANGRLERWSCHHQPIDVVYTWVNGSDDQFQRDLAGVEDAWLRRAVPPGWRAECGLADCVPAPLVVVVPPLPRLLTPADVRHLAGHAAPLDVLPSPLPELAATVLRYGSVDEAQRVLARPHFRIGDDGYTLFQTVWTSDEAVNSVRDDSHVLVTGARASELSLAGAKPATLAEAAVVARRDGVSVLRLPQSHAHVLTSRGHVAIDSERWEVRPAWLVLQQTEVDRSAVAAGRFTDNDELRYSLRSLERFAPWVRHVYLVTNGQIPDWLSLDSARLTLVTHDEIFPDGSHLPTFSSSAIETHLHRITGLSERFLYFNDDVMLGASVWPEDFVSAAVDYRVYLAWPLPACATDCPRLWLRDGRCDAACNTLICGWDGGDCTSAEPQSPRADGDNGDDDTWLPTLAAADAVVVDEEPPCAAVCPDSWLGDGFCDPACDVMGCAHDLADCGLAAYPHLVDLGPLRDGVDYTLPPPTAAAVAAFWNMSTLARGLSLGVVSFPPRLAVRALVLNRPLGVLTLLLRPNATLQRLPVFVTGTRPDRVGADAERLVAFSVSTAGAEADRFADHVEAVRHALNATVDAELERKLNAAERHLPNRNVYVRRRAELLLQMAALSSSQNHSVGRRLLMVPGNVTDHRPVDVDVSKTGVGSGRRRQEWMDGGTVAHSAHAGTAPPLDAYGASLLHVDGLFTQRYGPEHRRAVAHMPHLLERRVIAALQAHFPAEFAHTSAAHVRSPYDMQLAFSYFYYLMSEQTAVSADQRFDEFDTDSSGTWSDREIRTLATRLRSAPLSLTDVKWMWSLLRRCAAAGTASSDTTTIPGERYLDSDLTTLSRDCVLGCEELQRELRQRLGTHRPRHGHHVFAADPVAFVRVPANASQLVGALDALRRAPRKFLCFNNEVPADSDPAEAELVYALLADFFASVLPRASQFELPAGYRNRFSRVWELRRWRWQRSALRAVTVGVTVLLVLSLLRSYCEARLHRRWRRSRRAAQLV